MSANPTSAWACTPFDFPNHCIFARTACSLTPIPLGLLCGLTLPLLSPFPHQLIYWESQIKNCMISTRYIQYVTKSKCNSVTSVMEKIITNQISMQQNFFQAFSERVTTNCCRLLWVYTRVEYLYFTHIWTIERKVTQKSSCAIWPKRSGREGGFHLAPFSWRTLHHSTYLGKLVSKSSQEWTSFLLYNGTVSLANLSDSVLFKTIKMVYHEHVVILWGQAFNIIAVSRLQKKIVHILTYSHPRGSCRNLFKNL